MSVSVHSTRGYSTLKILATLYSKSSLECDLLEFRLDVDE